MTLSILIPVYNVGKYLARCLNSVYPQIAGKDCEVIIVDDGSTDDSGLLCDEYQKQHTDNTEVHHISNAGAYHARNYAIDHCHGDFVWLIDPDDYIANGCISQILNLLHTTPDIDILQMNYKKFGLDDMLSPKVLHIEEGICDGDEFLSKDKPDPYLWSKVYRKTFLQESGIRFNDKLYTQGDWLFNIYAFLHAKKIVQMDWCAYNYFEGNPTSTLHNPKMEYKYRGVNNSIIVLTELKNLIDKTDKDCRAMFGLQEQLSMTSAGFLYSLSKPFFSLSYINEQITKLAELGIYPIKKTKLNKRANKFMLLANHKWMYLAYIYIVVKKFR